MMGPIAARLQQVFFPSSDVPMPGGTQPTLYVNGKQYDLPDGYAEYTLLEYLREIRLKGTKLGCGEGGCGACTVMVSHWSPADQKIMHRAVNACLAPLYSVEGMHVVTVEGIGNRKAGLHPVQDRLAKAHGSQCGFCTPGFVMSMYSLLRTKGASGPPTEEEIEEALAGNLCRCTGYRPILDAFRTFTKTDDTGYTRDAVAAAGGGGAGTSAGKVCPSTGRPCDCSQGTKAEGAPTEPKPEGAVCSGGCCASAGEAGSAEAGLLSAAEPIFPSELRTRVPPPLALKGNRGTQWFRPITLKGLLELKAKYPEAKLVGGNTEVGIETKIKGLVYPVSVATTHVPELMATAITEKGVEFGVGITLTALGGLLAAALAAPRPQWAGSGCIAIINQLKWFAGSQVRNVSSVGGNIATASPISDLNPLWIACGAVFTVMSTNGSTREVAAKDMFLGYRKIDLKPTEVLLSVFLPFTRQLEYVKEFKQSHRRDDDIAIVNAGMRVAFTRTEAGTLEAAEAAISFGGVAAKTVSAPKTATSLVGKPWTEETVKAALLVLEEELPVPPNAPGGMAEFRRSLMSGFLFKFFLWAGGKLEAEAPEFALQVPPSFKSAAQEYHHPAPRGLQYFTKLPEGNGTVAGISHMHQSADLQVTGEAEYVDDVPLPENGLHGVLVLSTVAHARLRSVDPAPALAVPGVVGFFGAKDVPGKNTMGVMFQDEEVFASETVVSVGSVIGVVVANSHETARIAARKVAIDYEPLPAVLTIEDAVKAGSFSPNTNRILQMGDVDACFASGQCTHVIEGDGRMGAQEHFYLEPNSCTVWPVDNGNEIHMFSSTQCPDKSQVVVADVLSLPRHRVVVRTKRLGGGFGGKESRSAFVTAAAAVPAQLLGRPVRITLDRDTDMQTTGMRHPFMGKYKVGFTEEGKILALDVQLWCNGGYSGDLSFSVLERAMFHSDNVYAIPNLRVRGEVCKTNIVTNTAFRGFGGPQGMMITEMWMDHVARTLNKPPEKIKELNFQSEGYLLHYGEVLEKCYLQGCWAELMETSEFAKRRVEVDAYNKEHRWRKRGLAIVPTKYGISFTTKFLNQAGSLVHVYQDGTVLVSHGGVEMGQGLNTKVAQVAAHTLGIPLASVFISETATDKVPNASPTAASASSDLYGGATLAACVELKTRMQPMIDKMPGKPFGEIARACYLERINLSAQGFYATPDIGIDWATGKGRPFAYFTYGVAAAEVEVDVLTGDMHVRRADVVMDLGKSINPAIDIGQIEGAFVQGMGWCALEEIKFGDPDHPWVKPGGLFTQGPGSYKLPTVNDIPLDFRVSILKDAENPRAVLSSKAVGEPPLFMAACVFFAIKDAIGAARAESGLTGHFVLDSPATPERIRMACADDFTRRFIPADVRPKISI